MAEQPLWIESAGAKLEAILATPDGDDPAGLLVVCHPHPLRGGSMDNNVVAALCDAALQEGMAALRFNFRGVGRSSGSHGGGEAEVSDVLAALAAAAQQPGGERLALAGYSFGAAMAAAALAAGAVPLALALVSLPLRSADPERIAARPVERLFIAGDRDPLCPADELQALAARMQPAALCSIVDGADHFWVGYEGELRDTVGGFLRWSVGAAYP